MATCSPKAGALLLTCIFFPCCLLSCQDDLRIKTENNIRWNLSFIRYQRKRCNSSDVHCQLSWKNQDDSFRYFKISIKTMLLCSNRYMQVKFKSGISYCWEGALSKYLSEFEVLRLLLSWLGSLDRLLRVVIWVMAPGWCANIMGFWGGALHAGAMATACAWDSKWRAGVRTVSYHWWMRTGTDDNAGLNGHNIILEQETLRIREASR